MGLTTKSYGQFKDIALTLTSGVEARLHILRADGERAEADCVTMRVVDTDERIGASTEEPVYYVPQESTPADWTQVMCMYGGDAAVTTPMTFHEMRFMHTNALVAARVKIRLYGNDDMSGTTLV